MKYSPMDLHTYNSIYMATIGWRNSKYLYMDGVAQWLARLTSNREITARRDFEPNKRLPLWARTVTTITQYWLIPGTTSSCIYISRITYFAIKLK